MRRDTWISRRILRAKKGQSKTVDTASDPASVCQTQDPHGNLNLGLVSPEMLEYHIEHISKAMHQLFPPSRVSHEPTCFCPAICSDSEMQLEVI